MPLSQSGGVTPSALAGYEIGYDQMTTTVSVASSTEATGTTLISCAAHTFDGAAVMCQIHGYLTAGSVATIVQCSLFESTTEIGKLNVWSLPAASTSNIITVTGWLRFTPTAGSHTYTLTAFANNTTGTQAVFSGGAGGTGAVVPAFVRFTKV